MKMTLEMAPVDGCAATDCFYNVQSRCSARAITIGDGMHPGCDTFLAGSRHSHAHKLPAGVGACKVSACTHNNDCECGAEAVRIARENGRVRCVTFSAR